MTASPLPHPSTPLRRVTAGLLGTLLAASLVVAMAAAPSAAAPSPAATSELAPYPTLGAPPAGANDWSCTPTRRRPLPAVIVHGTFGDQKSLLDRLSLTLKRDGFCVYALDYGNRATGRIQRSARQLRHFVNRVLAATGARRVEMVGHSQGGMMPRYYIKRLGGRRHVEDLVGLSPSNHGTVLTDVLDLGVGCPACRQQAAGSRFLRRLNHPDETPGRVDYTQVTTTHDEVVVPYTSAFLSPGRHTTNILLQDRCPADPAEHLTIPLDGQAIAWVLDAFHRDGPADPHAAVPCL